MFRVRAIPLTDTVLSSSSVPENDFAAFSGASDYALGDRVIRTQTHRIYEALGAITSGGSNPEDDPLNWLDVGATNRWKPFDYSIADQAVGDDMEWVLRPPSFVDRVLFFNAECESVTVFVENGGTTLQNETFLMTDNAAVSTFFEWITTPPEFLNTLAVPILFSNGAEITVTVNGTDAKVGQILFGRLEDLGIAVFDTSVTQRDFSTIEPNIFGVRRIVKRASTFDFNFHVRIQPERAPFLFKRIYEGRGDPSAFLGTSNAKYGTIVLGLVSKFDLDYSDPSLSNYVIRIDGLI